MRTTGRAKSSEFIPIGVFTVCSNVYICAMVPHWIYMIVSITCGISPISILPSILCTQSIALVACITQMSHIPVSLKSLNNKKSSVFLTSSYMAISGLLSRSMSLISLCGACEKLYWVILSATWRSRGDSMVLITISFSASLFTNAVAKVDLPSPGAPVMSTPRASSRSRCCTLSSSSYCSSVLLVTGLTAVISSLLVSGGLTTTTLYGPICNTCECCLSISTKASSIPCISASISVISACISLALSDLSLVTISHQPGLPCLDTIGWSVTICTDITQSAKYSSSI